MNYDQFIFFLRVHPYRIIFPFLYHFKDLEYNITMALEIAKKLLKYHFDFVIMEYFSQARTTVALSKAFHSPLKLNKEMQHTDNSGLFKPASAGNEFTKSVVLKYAKKGDRLAMFKKTTGVSNSTHSTPRRLTGEAGKKSFGTLRSWTVSTKVIHPIRDEKKMENISGDKTRRRRLTLYRNGMPASVLTYLEKDNAADLELYQFALGEYEKRSKDEGWE